MVDVYDGCRSVTMRSLVSRPALLSILCVSMLSACTTRGTRPAGGGLFGRGFGGLGLGSERSR